MAEWSKARMTINESAPVVGRSEIEIAADPKVAWNVLTAIGRWPDWNPAVKSVPFEEGIEEGSEFRWKAGPGSIWSTIQNVDAPWRIVWTGSTFGIKAIHVHTLEPRAGGTLVKTEESYDGLVARVFHRRLQETLDTTLDNEVRHLKAEAERRDRSG
jgi:Polyketide cyclase / dehydrase and lipid transport